jgi:hypothetical protein
MATGTQSIRSPHIAQNKQDSLKKKKNTFFRVALSLGKPQMTSHDISLAIIGIYTVTFAQLLAKGIALTHDSCLHHKHID